jgi:site-specific DNA-cytosine methylase
MHVCPRSLLFREGSRCAIQDDLTACGIPQYRRRLIILAAGPGELAKPPAHRASTMSETRPPWDSWEWIFRARAIRWALDSVLGTITIKGIKICHPTGRPFTVGETATTHRFSAGRAQALKQIGNAVFAKAMTSAVVDSLRETNEPIKIG